MIESLRLFKVVPEGYPEQPVFIKEYGVVVMPTAVHAINYIKEYLRQNALTHDQLNASFHKSWRKVRDANIEQLVIEQMMHYITVYGYQRLNIYEDSTVYIPCEALEWAEMPVKIITSASNDDLIRRAIDILSSPIALTQQTITDCVRVAKKCGYTFTGDEVIRNREAAIIIADTTGIIPKNEILRYIVYKATGKTLLVKSPDLLKEIAKSEFILPEQLYDHLHLLAQSFNRSKEYWLAFKQAHKSNARFVNKLSKASKQHHKPLESNVLSTLTHKYYDKTTVMTVAYAAPIFQVIRAINALRYYSVGGANRLYRIRNGKGWVKQVDSPNYGLLSMHEDALLQVLRDRLRVKSAYLPTDRSYAFPTSEKNFCGCIPAGTYFDIPAHKGYHSMVGIYWKNANGRKVDLDLKASSVNQMVGWDGAYRNDDLLFSGDITSAPNGASEWLYQRGQNSLDPYIITVNQFNGPIDHPYRVIIGYAPEDAVHRNYIINPADVIHQFNASMTQKEVTLGLLTSYKHGIRYYVTNQGLGSRMTSRYNPIAVGASIAALTSMLRLSDVIEHDPHSDVRFDKYLSKDDLLSLFD